MATGRFTLALACSMLLSAVAARAADWTEDYKAALAEAKKSGKVVLADFTGSDWCGWCIRLKAEVFDTKEFKAWADKNAVLLELDFPRDKQLADDVKKQNRDLQEKFGIRGYPTILFLDAEGKELGRSGYMAGGPDAWLKNADGIVEKARPAVKTMSLAAGLKAAVFDTALLLVLNPAGDPAVGKVMTDAAFADYAKLRLSVVQLKGKVEGDDATALADLARKYDFTPADGKAQIVLIGTSEKKALLVLDEVPAPDVLLASLRKALPAPAYDGKWLDDCDRGLLLAAELKRPAVVWFSGAGWNTWCRKLDKEVFATDTFKAFAKDQVVLIQVDFPKEATLSAEAKSRKVALVERYGVEAFPTLIVLSPQGKPLGKLGYIEGGPDAFLPKLKALLK